MAAVVDRPPAPRLIGVPLPPHTRKTVGDVDDNGLPAGMTTVAGDFGETAWGIVNIAALTDPRALRRFRPIVDRVSTVMQGEQAARLWIPRPVKRDAARCTLDNPSSRIPNDV